MDTVAAKLARLALGLKFDDLSEEVLKKAKQMLLDTLGCALGGYLSEPSMITRSVVEAWGGVPEATIIGVGLRVPCNNAALANGVMVRYLDFNDVYPGRGHPSEILPTILAVGEKQHIDGRELITTVALGYEIVMRIADALPHPPGSQLRLYDPNTQGAFCAPLVAGRLLGLTEEQMIKAVGISGSHNLALIHAFRAGGQITMMKAMGYGFAAQSGIMAALMAREGLTGQGDVIEIYNEAAGGGAADELARLADGEEKMKIMQTNIKQYAAEYMIHSPAEALLKVLKEHPLQPDDVKEISIKIFKRAISQVRSYNPETREEADHNMQYCLAVAFMEGDLGPDQFTREQWKDPKVREFMTKIKLSEDPEFTKLYPEASPALVEILTTKGDVYSAKVDDTKGRPKTPMTDEEIQAKFRKLASTLMEEGQIRKIIDTVYNLEAEPDTCNLMSLLTV
ncbi:MmgE/PrpD family protein [Chloroflexota bacterium]